MAVPLIKEPAAAVCRLALMPLRLIGGVAEARRRRHREAWELVEHRRQLEAAAQAAIIEYYAAVRAQLPVAFTAVRARTDIIVEDNNPKGSTP